jgi:hypothetical protein
MSQLPSTFPAVVSRSCFAVLWTAKTREATQNLDFVKWLDGHWKFKLLGLPLQSWSHMDITEPEELHCTSEQQSFTIGAVRSAELHHTSEQLTTFISTINKVVSNGMRPATVEDVNSGEEYFVMVPPQVQQGDQIHVLPACSVPVALRPTEHAAKPYSGCHNVIGGVHLPDEGLLDTLQRQHDLLDDEEIKLH